MEKEREKYEAFFYYLRESPEYQIYCEWMKIREKDPESPWTEKELPPMGLRMTYDFFGDVFNVEFDAWYKNRKDKDRIGAIEYTRLQANYEFNVAMKEVFASKGKDLSIDEFMDEFRNRFMNRLFDHIPGSFLSRVCLNPVLTNKELKTQFGKMVSDKRDTPEIKQYEEQISEGWLPVGDRIHPERLMRFLRVKQLEDKGWDFVDIADELNPNGNEGEDPAPYYSNHARKIIENVKNGTFPGKYTENSEPD